MIIADILRELTLGEKASLCSGEGSWDTKALSRLNIPSIHMTDGPCGVRNQKRGQSKADPATCFPAPCLLACSFDPELLAMVGSAIGEECRAIGVHLLLAPGVNLKRSPLGGRNFEYFSEDPLLTGMCAAGYIRGVQTQGVGAVLKHFALNNQENWRLVSNSIVDEATMRELYLRPFEIAVKSAKPAAVMTSYNRVNGIYASEHSALLTGVLRDEWGYEGLVVSDWGAVNDRVAGLRAGMDFEMPGSAAVNDPRILKAVQTGELSSATLDTAVERILTLVERLSQSAPCTKQFDINAHHALARRAAAESVVLLENNGLLPLSKTPAIIGRLAEEPHFQGSGSAHVNPTEQDNFLAACHQAGLVPSYAPGWASGGHEDENPALLRQATGLARNSENVVLFLGTEASDESEGFDRKDFQLSNAQQQLARAVIEANRNTVVVVQAGGVVDLACAEGASAVLYAYLSGQSGGAALYDLIFGEVSPSGKLPETFPLRLEDTPCYDSFGLRDTFYTEKTAMGYRFYNAVNKNVRWPFGHGLTYSDFELKDVKAITQNASITVSGVLQNIGNTMAAQTVQVYASEPGTEVHALCGFIKLKLRPNEKRTFSVNFPYRQMAHFDAVARRFVLDAGNCHIQVGFSSRDIQHACTLYCERWTGDQLIAALVPTEARIDNTRFHPNSTVQDLLDTDIGKMLFSKLSKELEEERKRGEIDDNFYHMYLAQIRQYPLRTFVLATHGKFTWHMLSRLLTLLDEPSPDMNEAAALLQTIRVI